MKKRYLLTLVAFAMTVVAMALPVSEEEALKVAMPYTNNANAKIVNSTIMPAKGIGGQSTHNLTTPYYIISRGEGQGFVIVSGDDCLPLLLGYTDTGDYDEDNMPESFRGWLQYRADVIAYAQSNGVNKPYQPSVNAASEARPQNVPELLKTLWHQNSPYNDKCPTRKDNGGRCVTGCVATAASQIVYYWRREANKELQYDTPKYCYGDQMEPTDGFVLKKGTPVDFSIMKTSYGSSDSQASREAVATLCAAVGMSGHLTYGSSTGGQIADQVGVFSGQFGLKGGTCVYKNPNYSEEAWANLLYSELIQGHPLLYCGNNSSQGGHAVVCDGYQASTQLFHINFGWGSGYNGYFSVVDGVQGWGFNENYQGCVYGIAPARQLVDFNVNMPEHLYKDVKNTITVDIANNGTLSFSGVYLFATTVNSVPSKLTDAKDFDDYTVIPSDGTGKVELTLTPTSSSTLYITVTDKNLRVLGKATVAPEHAEKGLTVNNIEVYASPEDNYVGEINYKKVYSSYATVNATAVNTGEYDWTGTAKVLLWSSADNGATWTSKTVSNTTASLPAGVSSILQFNVTGLKSGYLYKVTLNHEWGKAAPFDIVTIPEGVTDTIAYFSCAGASNLAATLEGNVLKFTGKWDAVRYKTFCERTTNVAALNYDLTECESVGKLPLVVYPSWNAMFYAKEGVEGVNVVHPDGVCDSLSLTPGYDFAPMAAFRVKKASLFLGQVPNTWNMITVPFDCKVPDGIVAREVTGKHSKTATSSVVLYNKLAVVSEMKAGKTYLIMTSSDKKQTLSPDGELADVVTEVSESAVDPAFIGAFTNVELPTGAKVLPNSTSGASVFANAMAGSRCEALRGYFYDSDMAGTAYRFTAAPNMVDSYYVTLGTTIQKLYDLYDEMNKSVSAAANKQMLGTIAEAEEKFTKQELTYLQVNNYVKELNAFAAKYPDMVILGDANDDGSITMDDANMVVNKYLGNEAQGMNLKQADANGDGAITMDDANIIVNKYLGN